MIKDLDYSNRQLLPRWRPFKDFGQLHPQKKVDRPLNEIEDKDLKNAQENWEQNRTIPYALELITLSHIFELSDTYQYKTAIDFILDDHSDILSSNSFLADFLGKTNNNPNHQENIRFLKKQIHQNCTNASLWVDLAYFYKTLGQNNQASKAIQTALYLRPSNVILVRAISKYFLLQNEIDNALALLQNDSIKDNPLIISAEIAISEAYHEKSRLLRKGISVTKNNSISRWGENELFATIGTLEFNSGNSKKGKKLIQQSLLYPNENLIAQTRYISSKFQKDFDISPYNVPNRYETDAWLAYDNNNFSKVLEMSEKWFYYQPFTSTAAVMNSYIRTLIFQEEKASIEMANKALKVCPDSFSLQNNLVVSLLRDNQIEKGNEEFEKLKKFKISTINNDKDVLLATSGLVDYRNGRIKEGELKYRQAVDNFKKSNDFEKMCRCYYYWGCEEKNAQTSNYLTLIQSAKNLADKYNYNDIQIAIQKNFSLPFP